MQGLCRDEPASFVVVVVVGVITVGQGHVYVYDHDHGHDVRRLSGDG